MLHWCGAHRYSFMINRRLGLQLDSQVVPWPAFLPCLSGRLQTPMWTGLVLHQDKPECPICCQYVLFVIPLPSRFRLMRFLSFFSPNWVFCWACLCPHWWFSQCGVLWIPLRLDFENKPNLRMVFGKLSSFPSFFCSLLLFIKSLWHF